MNTESKTHLANGLTAEEVMSMYFDTEAILAQPKPLYRLDHNGHRSYYTVEPDGEIKIYTSVTTMIKKTTPTSPYLINWMLERGKEKSEQERDEAADYGTFMHMQCAELMIARKYDLAKVDEELPAYIEECGYSKKLINSWASELKKDILAFAAFMIEHDVKPIAIEMCLASEKGYAGAIDIVASMNIEEKGYFGEVYKTGDNKGLPKESKRKKRIRAIVDMKSGRKGFYEDHEIQLRAYKDMWEENFPEHPIEKVFNWSPKDWRSEPTFNLKDQTDSVNAHKLPHLISLAAIEESKREKSISICEGEINLEKGLVLNYRTISISELLKTRINERQTA